MKKQKKNLKKVIYLSLCLMSFAFMIIFLCAINIKPFKIFAIISTFLFLWFWFIGWVTNKDYKLRYIFFGRDFKKKIVCAIEKFNTTNKDFIKELILDAKTIYRYRGNVIHFSNSPNLTKYSDAQTKLEMLYQELLLSIESQKGFSQFFEAVEKMDYSRGESYYLMNNNFLSNELRYLLFKVYDYTLFTLGDNGFSERFTELNKNIVEKTNTVYSPILFNFKKEIEEVLNKIKSI